MPSTDRTGVVTNQHLSELVYELLDAHGDTLLLAAEFDHLPDWAAHLDYLRKLQRIGRETLARVGSAAA